MKISFEHLQELQERGNVITLPSSQFFDENGNLREFVIVDEHGQKHYLNDRIRSLLQSYQNAKQALESIFEKQ